MSNPVLDGDLNRLADALRALPQAAPERSVWPELAAKLQCGLAAGERESAMERATAVTPVPLPTRAAAPGRRRWLVPAALAAAVALVAFSAWRYRHAPGAPAPTLAAAPAAATVAPLAASDEANAANVANTTDSTNGQPAGARLATLQRRSQALEHWLRETARAAGPLHGQDLAAAAELEDMIGLVDVQLGAGARDSEVTLWQRRVALLEDLTALRYSSYSLAETGSAAAALAPAALTN